MQRKPHVTEDDHTERFRFRSVGAAGTEAVFDAIQLTQLCQQKTMTGTQSTHQKARNTTCMMIETVKQTAGGQTLEVEDDPTPCEEEHDSSFAKPTETPAAAHGPRSAGIKLAVNRTTQRALSRDELWTSEVSITL